MTVSRLLVRTSLAATVALLAGCYAVPPPVYVLQTPPAEVAVPAPPPDPPLEVRPAPPDESSVWQEGYWGWDGTDYAWAAGQWVEAPQPGYVFVQPSWYFERGSWRYRPPYWCHPSHAPSGRNHPRRSPGAVAAAAPWRQPDPPNAVRVRAPDVITPSASHTRVRAPDASSGPDALPSTVRVVAPPAPSRGAPLPAWSDARKRQLERTVVLKDSDNGKETGKDKDNYNDGDRGGDRGKVNEAAAVHPEPEPLPVRASTSDVRARPEYRGARAGRPVFGDDPTSVRPGPRVIYPTDRTGAIVLSEAGGASQRGVVLEQPGDAPVVRAIDIAPAAPSFAPRRRYAARPLPEARTDPPPQPGPPAMRHAAPDHVSAARLEAPSPSPVSAPAARVESPSFSPVSAPAARVEAPSARVEAPSFSPVYAPAARVESPSPVYAPPARVEAPSFSPVYAPSARVEAPSFSPVYAPAARVEAPSFSPVYAPPARVYAPAASPMPSAPLYRAPQMHAPAPMTPSYHAGASSPVVRSAPAAPAPSYRAPAQVAPSGGGGRRR